MKRAVRPLLVLWTALLLWGAAAMVSYATRPGTPAAAPASWPSTTELPRAAGRWTLLLFLHPRCPCSEASLTELGRLLEEPLPPLDAHLVFLDPSEEGAAWTRTSLWRRAQALRGVRLHEDLDGREAARFGCRTSGEALLYDPEGQLAYAGGLTVARGHEGPGEGCARLRRALESSGGASLRGAVFGCPLFDDASVPVAPPPPASDAPACPPESPQPSAPASVPHGAEGPPHDPTATPDRSR